MPSKAGKSKSNGARHDGDLEAGPWIRGLAFIGAPPTELHEVAHHDGDPSNNAVTNLRWATRAENHADKLRHGTHNRGERHPLSKVTDAQVAAMRASTRSAKHLAAEHGICPAHAWALKNGKRRSHHERNR